MVKPKNNIHWLKYAIASFLPPLALIWLYRENIRKKDRTFWNVTVVWAVVWSLCVVGLLVVPNNYQSNIPNLPSTSEAETSTENNTSIADSNLADDQTGADADNSRPDSSSSSNASTPSIWDQPSDAVADNAVGGEESDIATTNPSMSGIEIKEAENVPYSRDSYGSGWNAGSGCNIRARMLQSASTIPFTTSNGCTVTYGSWIDPYTGNTFTGNPYQGDDGTANDLDIDHIIPLSYVNSHGGYYWTDSEKVLYGSSLEAMNNGVYIVVSASENRKKGDKGPSEYYPPNNDYKCEYSRLWRDIARLYSIALSYADYVVVADTLEACGIE